MIAEVRSLLAFLGEDPERPGLRETPGRFVRALVEQTAGYKLRPQDVLKVFEDGAERVDSMVVVRDIPFYSLCEHHIAPFFGTATIGYIPNEERPRIVGLSKLARLLDVFAKRLQVQERLTQQIAAALMAEPLEALGAGCVIRARHLCMESRGVKRQGSETVTSCLEGVFRDPGARSEFLAL